jgi:hypothetical protein
MSSSSPRRAATLRSFEFEDLVAELFERRGFAVQREVRMGGFWVDLIVEGQGRRSAVEISTVSDRNAMAKIRADAERLRGLQAMETAITNPIIIVASELTPEAKAWAEQQYGLEIWDQRALLEAAAAFPEITERLQRFYEKAAPQGEKVTKDEVNPSLQKRLSDHIRENTLTPLDYEALCMSVFAHLFDPCLSGCLTKLLELGLAMAIMRAIMPNLT